LNEKSEIIKIRVCRISKDLVINLQLTKALNIDYPILLKTLVVDLKKIFPSVGRIFIVSRILTDNELRIEPIFLSKKIAKLIENRTRFKSLVIKRLLTQTSDVCNGIKVLCKGRLNGADMAGSDFLSLGSIPFQTLDAKIAYGFSVANTPKGLQSIKVWVYNK
jgi:small subunit ribosomal protein S3